MSPGKTAFAALALAACFLAGRVGCAQTPSVEQGIEVARDAYIASDFLGDSAELGRIEQSDPGGKARLVTEAAQLKDLKELIDADLDPNALNRGLAQRFADPDPRHPEPGYFGFGQRLPDFLDWTRRDSLSEEPRAAGLDTPDRTRRIRQAVMEWSDLPDDARQWLSSRGYQESSWEPLSFAQRRRQLMDRAALIKAWLMASVPRTKAEFDSMRAAADGIDAYLDRDASHALWDRLETAKVSVDGLDKIAAKVDQMNDPGMKALLEKARTGSLEDTTAALAQLYDKMGIPNPALQSRRPPTPAESFDASSRQVLADLLRTSVLQQTGGTDAGDQLRAFYQNHSLTVHVAPSGPGNVAWYDQERDDISFNEKFVQDWLQGEKLTTNDLLRDTGGALERLSILIAPSFVHEATHQRQSAWARQRGFDDWASQSIETEAKAVETLFFLQKSRQDPKFKEVFQAAASHSMMARMEIGQANELTRYPATFRDIIMSDYYEDLPSLDAVSARELTTFQRDAAAARAEIERRKALPEDERERLNDGGLPEFPKGRYNDAARWDQDLTKLNAIALYGQAAYSQGSVSRAMRTYDGYLQRETDSLGAVEDAVKRLDAGSAPRKKDEVPPPNASSF